MVGTTHQHTVTHMVETEDRYCLIYFKNYFNLVYLLLLTNITECTYCTAQLSAKMFTRVYGLKLSSITS